MRSTTSGRLGMCAAVSQRRPSDLYATARTSLRVALGELAQLKAANPRVTGAVRERLLMESKLAFLGAGLVPDPPSSLSEPREVANGAC